MLVIIHLRAVGWRVSHAHESLPSRGLASFRVSPCLPLPFALAVWACTRAMAREEGTKMNLEAGGIAYTKATTGCGRGAERAGLEHTRSPSRGKRPGRGLPCRAPACFACRKSGRSDARRLRHGCAPLRSRGAKGSQVWWGLEWGGCQTRRARSDLGMDPVLQVAETRQSTQACTSRAHSPPPNLVCRSSPPCAASCDWSCVPCGQICSRSPGTRRLRSDALRDSRREPLCTLARVLRLSNRVRMHRARAATHRRSFRAQHAAGLLSAFSGRIGRDEMRSPTRLIRDFAMQYAKGSINRGQK